MGDDAATRTPTDRVEALLEALTLEEKAALTGGDDMWHLPAIERLGIGRLKVSDGPSGVRGERMGVRRSMSFPCGMSVGATWDTTLAGQYGSTLAAEATSKGVHVLLGPTVCISRTPLGGRTFESFAEDPVLSASLTAAYIRGVQAGNVGCCVKHFACNDQEHERMTISAEVDQRTLREVHLPSFEAAVRDAGTWSVMSAYNRVNGTYSSEHSELLGRILKEEWGFDGVVMSDWFGAHSTVEAAVAGLDVEMPGPPQHLGSKLVDAVREGRLAESLVDEHARRVLRLMERTGLLDTTPSPDEAQDDDPDRRAMARRIAISGTVLLANDGLLPLEPSVRRVAVIGPNADLLERGGGGSSEVLPHRLLSLVDELRERLPEAEISFDAGCRLEWSVPTIDPRLICEGFRVDYYANRDLDGDPVATDVFGQGRLLFLGDPLPGVAAGSFSIRARATFTPNVSGAWELGIANAGLARLFLDDEPVVDNTEPTPGTFIYGFGSELVTTTVELEAARDYALAVELRALEGVPLAGVQISAGPPPIEDLMERAVAAARAADVTVLVVGANSQWEAEGGDRTNLRLVGDQDELARRVLEANPRTAVIVNCGAPIEMPWAGDAAAVAMAWYPGEEGAPALADILTGTADPGGRLPITFPARLEDGATYRFYPGSEGRVVYGEGLLIGYRHFDAAGVDPAYCFGHGLSFTTFERGEPAVEVTGSQVVVAINVTNTGSRRGSDVVQLYVGDVESSVPRPVKELKAFAKVELDPGETATVRLELGERDFSFWDEGSHTWRLESGEFDLYVGASSRAIDHRARLAIESLNGSGGRFEDSADLIEG